MTDPVPAVLFDFDGTLTTRDSFRAVLRQGWRERPWTFLLAAAGFPVFALSVLARGEKRYVKSWLLWTLTVGLKHRRALEQLASWGRSLGSDESFWRDDVIARYHGHRNAGQLLIICTASAAEWVAPAMEAAGLRCDVMLGSPLVHRWGGLMLGGPNCYAKEKTRRIERWLRLRRDEKVRFVASYSDHPSDIPLLNLADTAWVILRKASDARQFRKRLAAPWRVVGSLDGM